MRRGDGLWEAEQEQEHEGKSNVNGKALVISQILDAIPVFCLALRCRPHDLLHEHTVGVCVCARMGRVAEGHFM